MRLFRRINTRTIYILSIVTGVVTGFGALLFNNALHWILDFTSNNLTHMPSLEASGKVLASGDLTQGGNKVLFFMLPIIGGLITGLIIQFWGAEAKGGGTETFLDSFHNKAGVLRKRTTAVKFLASLATLGTGGSGGKEGPMTLIGASLGSIFGKFTNMGARAQRTMLLAGAAGGLGAIFRTPLGGAITAVEVLYKEDFESDSLIPCIISSVTAYTTFGAFAGYGHLLHFTAETFHSPIELVFYAILAVLCTGMALIFVRLYHAAGTDFFDKLPLPPFMVPAFGGLLLAIIGLFVPEVLGGGLGVIQQTIYGAYSADWQTACQFFLLLAFLKIFTTTFTVQSGGSAGLMVPSLFIGAMLGGACGTFFHQFLPELVPSVTPFIVVGMAAFFAATTNASLGSLVMVTELTGGYELLPPLMLVSVLSLIISHKWGIFNNQTANKFFSKAHLWDMNPAILKNVQISTGFDSYQTQAIINSDALYTSIKVLARKCHMTDFLVQDKEGKLKGLLSLHDLEFEDEEDLSGLDQLIAAEDMMHTDVSYVTPTDSLFKAMQFLSTTDFEIVPVIDDSRVQSKLLGYLTRKDILKFYNELGTKK